MTDHLIIGIGGAGNNIAAYIHQHRSWPVLAINTDSQALGERTIPKRLLIGAKSCGGSPAHSPERGQQAAKESLPEIDKEIADYSTIVVIAGLGGGTGTGATSVIIERALTLGKRVIAAVVLPYEYETKRRVAASQALEELSLKPIQLIVHDNADLLKDGGGSLSMSEVLEGLSLRMAEDIDAALTVTC